MVFLAGTRFQRGLRGRSTEPVNENNKINNFCKKNKRFPKYLRLSLLVSDELCDDNDNVSM